MIAFVSGSLASKNPTEVVVDVGGLGYRLMIPASSFDGLPALGEPVRLHASFIVREDSQTLYGFASPEERQMFETMIAVSGVGPKLALAALSAMSPTELRNVLIDGDAGMLTRIPGVGKKTAERLIVELRDRISSLGDSGDSSPDSGGGVSARARADARAGLQALGLSRAEAESRVRAVLRERPMATSAEEMIRLALRPT